MSPEPLSLPEAKRRIIDILQNGTVSFSAHARQEMANDGRTAVDVVQVLRGGVMEPPEVVFCSAQALVVVTARRSRR